MRNKILICFLMVLSIFILSGCGHNITHTDRGTGMVVRIPTPDGNALIDLKIGKIDSTTTILRGGATYDSTTSTGGSWLGTIGTSEHVQIKTTPQCNEGNVRDILTSPYCPANVKEALTNYLHDQNAPVAAQSSSSAVGASCASGSTAVKVAAPVDVSHPITQVANKVASVANNITGTVKLTIILIAIGIAILIALIVWIISKIKKRNIQKQAEKAKAIVNAGKKLYSFIR